jgi:murein DD-endopeptidase MepM/ murein hydrolase activator NlpD
VLLAFAVSVFAASRNEERVKRLSGPVKKQLESFQALSVVSLDEVGRAMAADKLEARTREVLATGSLYPGADRGIHRYLRTQLDRLATNGVEFVGSLQAPAMVPVTLPGTVARVGDQSWPVQPLWPNGAMPALCPTNGLAGKLVWVGNGEWADIEGQELRDTIAVMTFAGGRNWERLYAHGVRAVIVVNDGPTLRERAEGLFSNMPVPCPRFLVDAKAGAALKALAGQACRLDGGAWWEERVTESLFAYLPPTAPVSHVVREGETVKDLAARYGVTVEALAASNNLAGVTASLPVGQTLVVPNVDATLLVLVALDAVNVAPDAPHGAQSAANVAAALAALEHLATSPTAVRRKGIVFGFLDGEHLGGLASRTMAEQFMRTRGKWASEFVEDQAAALARYRAVAAWRADPAQPLGPKEAEWYCDKWLKVRLDEQRITIAEERADRLQRGLPTTEQDARLAGFLTLSDQTIGKRGLPWPERAARFHAELGRGAAERIGWPAIEQRFRAELAEEEATAALAAHNRQFTQQLRAKLGQAGPLGFWLDLGDGSGSLVLSDARSRLRGFSMEAAAGRFAKRFRDVAAFAALQGDWTEDWPFLTGEDKVDVAFTVSEGPTYYPDFWQAGDVTLLPLTTANDPWDRLDTPADVVERWNFKNFSTQARTVLAMWKLGLESPLDSAQGEPSKRTPSFGRLVGSTLQFNVRSGLDAQQPVPGCLVYYPSLPRQPEAVNSSAVRGARRGLFVQSRLNGSYALPVETLQFNLGSKPVVYGYRLDRAAALVDMVVDRGQIGSQQFKADFRLLLNQDVEKKLIFTATQPLVFFPGTDPTDYSVVGMNQLVKVLDAVLKGEPAHFAYEHPHNDYGEQETDAVILYLPAGRRAQFTVRRADVYKLLLVGDVTDKVPDGAGMLVDGERLTVPLTPLVAARNMYDLALRRQALYRRFGITDKTVGDALDRAGEKLAAAEQAMADRHWQEGNGLAREAWGMCVKYFPRILTMGRQAVFSAVLLMAFLLPAAAFAEKLVLGGKGIVARLVGTTALFAAGVVFLNFLHPAFRISVSPFIVVIAYTMILMSAIVLVICYQRFEVVVRRARAAGGEVESEEISLVSSLSTALALGVSNLKKRKTRTFLTAFTVTALTFSIVTFVSVKGADTLLVRPVTLESAIEGQPVEPLPPKYDGLMLREMYWGALSRRTAAAFQSEFGTRFPVAVRGHYLEVEGGNNAEREGANQIEVRFGNKSTILMGIMGFDPIEREFSHLHEAVSGQQWFQPGDQAHVILPDEAATALGITPAMLMNDDGTRRADKELPVVRMMNRQWRVIGILDAKLADRYRDINGKSLAVVDYLNSAFTPSAGIGDVANETPSYHVAWRRLMIVPARALPEVNGKLRSVAVKFPEKTDTKNFFRDLALRVNRSVFGTVDGKINLITTQQKQSVGGIAKILVPVILAVLIVTNTMLGAVEERKGEVGMLGAIGLSPAQISFLLLSESLVFSVLGIVCGTFGGLLFANVVPWIRLHTDGQFLIALSLNFASLSAIGLALGTGVVVLLATLFPSKKAAKLAAPSGMEKWVLPEPDDDGRIRYTLPFTLTRGNAVGMTAFFRRFLLNHTEATSPDFNCRHVRLAQGESLKAQCTMWLQPYDLDVAQEFEMAVQPTDKPGIFAVALTLHRTSGTEEAWLRTNYGFLDLVRKQFLLWRNLDDASRKRYIAEGVEQFQRGNGGVE